MTLLFFRLIRICAFLLRALRGASRRVRRLARRRVLEHQTQARKNRRKGFRLGLDDEQIPALQHPPGIGRHHPETVADHADDLRVCILQHLLHFPDGLPRGLGTVPDARLGEVGAGLETTRPTPLPPRHDPPTGQRDEQKACGRDSQADRRKIEHAEAGIGRLLPETGHDEVRWGTDQRSHSAEDGPE